MIMIINQSLDEMNEMNETIDQFNNYRAPTKSMQLSITIRKKALLWHCSTDDASHY